MNSKHLIIEHQLLILTELVHDIDLKAMTRLQLLDLANIGESISKATANRLLELQDKTIKHPHIDTTP